MTYALLIMEPPAQREQRGVEAGREVYAEMERFALQLQERGVLRGVESLVHDAQATRVQVRDGKVRMMDGPFAEAKEMIGGLFLVDCATREEALAIAEACPAARWCTIEVRETGPCWA